MKILCLILLSSFCPILTLKAWFETRTGRGTGLQFSVNYLTPLKGDTNHSKILRHLTYIPASKLLDIESKPAEGEGGSHVVFVEYTDELPITFYRMIFQEAHFSHRLVIFCQQTKKLELSEEYKTKLAAHSKEIRFSQSSEWLYLNHASFAYLEEKFCTILREKVFENKNEITKKEFPSDFGIVNRMNVSKDLKITLLANLNVWKIIRTLYDTLKDYVTFTKFFKLDLRFLTLPQIEQPNGKSFGAYYSKDKLTEYQAINLNSNNSTGELFNFLVARLNENGQNIDASVYTELMKLQFCYGSNNNIEFAKYLKLLLDIQEKCIDNLTPSSACVVNMVEDNSLRTCIGNIPDVDIRTKLYLESVSNSIGIDIGIQTSFYGYKINSNTNLDPEDNEFSNKKDFEIIKDICKMKLAPEDKKIPDICRYDYCTDGFKYSIVLGKCVNVNSVDQNRVLGMFNLILLIAIMALIIGVAFIMKKIFKQQNRIGKINRSYSRLFGNKFDKIIENKTYIKE